MTSRSDAPRPRPVGDAFAVLDGGPVKGTERARRSRFVPLGPVWSTDSGNLRLQLDSEPLAWSDRRVRRTVMIRFRQEVTIKAAAGHVDELPP